MFVRVNGKGFNMINISIDEANNNFLNVTRLVDENGAAVILQDNKKYLVNVYKEPAIRPIRNDGGEFAEEILSDLLSQGFSGNELLQKFKEVRRQIRPAVESMLEEASAAASGK